MNELDDTTYSKIVNFCEDADSLLEESKPESALELFWRAFDYLPLPKEQWEAGTWIMAGIGDANFQNKDYVAGRDNLTMAMRFPNAVSNPFLHFRLGQCYFHLNDPERAMREFNIAVELKDLSIFDDEPNVYFDLYKSRNENQ